MGSERPRGWLAGFRDTAKLSPGHRCLSRAGQRVLLMVAQNQWLLPNFCAAGRAGFDCPLWTVRFRSIWPLAQSTLGGEQFNCPEEVFALSFWEA